MPFDCWLSCADALGEPEETAGALAREGVVGIRGVVPHTITHALCRHVDRELWVHKREATAADGDPREHEAIAAFDRWFGEVRDRKRRYDLKLAVDDDAVRTALRCLCMRLTPVLEQVATLDALVVELATLISDPGAVRQTWHPDSTLPSTSGAPLYTMFVALQTIDASMGPTQVMPRTHDAASHARLRGLGPGREDVCTGLHMACEAGDVVLMDSRLWHCGGHNGSRARRRLLYATLAVPYCLPKGSTYSILEELGHPMRLHHRLRLRSYMEWGVDRMRHDEPGDECSLDDLYEICPRHERMMHEMHMRS